ncbi:phosphotransferase enzyme family protein [Mucilaginibacter sp. SP1R1]|uniref:phosphotransferase enzyme family protein n=1 Tax=Mucilaginibacter sp. SP1R1 TaxID=2723091 RepID=UPI001621D593|nr:aminoglycoside phosphotransferase family protein [Mucilaginibacter sp. SP1R1]MBB6149680.1 thiamine kinase-like enzyme [Mucilaginibacter sp. SP1R1]
MYNDILNAFGLNPTEYKIEAFGSGLINLTYKLCGVNNYILQQINKNVFKSPLDIAANISKIQQYLKQTHRDYLFVAPLPAVNGDYLVQSNSGNFYRLFPFVAGSHTVNEITHKKEAFEAAKQFGLFTRLLNSFDTSLLKYTLTDFHNLSLRFDQFETASKTASAVRQYEARQEMKTVYEHIEIIYKYRELTQNNQLPLRVVHHDTKISNVLFDDDNNGLCVIDLDTVMPGYYLSDIGDMLRTYLSPTSEEEKDLKKIHIRHEYFGAIYQGYMSEMGTFLSDTEKQYFLFSGKMMIYMQALRFLTDFLNNDIYYGAAYPDQNLVRAKNQFTLLQKFIAAEDAFKQLMTAVPESNYH